MLWQRVLTALVGFPLIVALMGWGSSSLVHWAMAVFAGGCAFETARIVWNPLAVRFKANSEGRWLVSHIGTRMPVAWAVVTALGFLVITASGEMALPAIVTLFLGILLVSGFGGRTAEASAGTTLAAMTIVTYGILPWVALWGLYVMGPQARYLLLTLVIVWAGDTAAYFVGRAFGRHQLAPVISPKKTWEGAIGGLVASVLAALVVNAIYHGELATGWVIGVAGFAGGVAGQYGDLFESMLKRFAGIKDSGTLLPGHGGILDRLDAVLFAGPMVWIVILFAQRMPL